MSPSPLRPCHSALRVRGAASTVRSLVAVFAAALFVLLMWGAARDSAYADDALAPESAGSTEQVDVEAPVVEVEVLPSDGTAQPAAVESDDAVVDVAVVDVAAEEAAIEHGEAAVVLVPLAVETAPPLTIAVLAVATDVPVVVVATAPAEEAGAVTAANHTVPAVHQCNADTFPTGAGWEATCDVTIENTLGSDGATSSRVTTTWCLAEAGVLPPEGCDTDVVTSNSLITTVNQCNGILAGGSNVTCTVEVINNVPFGTPTTGVTVNQCVGSGQGGVSPGGPPTNCDPEDSSTSGATVTQCNGSANGGGAPERVQCLVVGGASALPVTVNQCNGSTAAGSTVTCGVVFTNNFAAAPVDTDTDTATETGAPVDTISSGGGGGPGVPVVSRPAPSGSSSRSTSRSTPATSLVATGLSTSTAPLLALAAMSLLFGALLLAGSKRGVDC